MTAAAPPPFSVNPRALRAHLEHRPFWMLHYHDRDDVFEGDPCRCGKHQYQDWLCRPAGRVKGIGLYTPDGLRHELGADYVDMTGKVFQLKMGVRTMVWGGTGLHLIGAISGLDGQCVVYSWEYDMSVRWEPSTGRYRGSGGRFVPVGGYIVGPFADNVYNMQYGGLGPLGLENLGLRL